MLIKFMRAKNCPSTIHWPVPAKATAGSAGFDLCSREQKWVPPGQVVLVMTGWHMEIPEGFEGQIRPRSGLCLKSGITVANAPGTIDSDYRNEVGVLLCNLSAQSFLVEPGARIAQIVFARTPPVEVEIVEELEPPDSSRNGGFGSTEV